MKTADLKAIQAKSFKLRTTESRHNLGYNDNLLLEHPALCAGMRETTFELFEVDGAESGRNGGDWVGV